MVAQKSLNEERLASGAVQYLPVLTTIASRRLSTAMNCRNTPNLKRISH
jgi:hypothetical protein